MAKYINADDIEYTKQTFCYGHGWYEDEEYVLKNEIDEMPAADVVPVEYIEERIEEYRKHDALRAEAIALAFMLQDFRENT